MNPPSGPIPPPDAIIFMSHSRIYMQQTDPIFTARPEYRMAILGSHTFLSYCWYLWKVFRGFWVYRPVLKAQCGIKPFHQIISFLKQNPSILFGIMPDSGGPYGQIKPTLLGLSMLSGRPLVALKPCVSHSIKIHGHLIPLPFAKVWCEFSRPIYPSELKEMGEVQARGFLQGLFR